VYKGTSKTTIWELNTGFLYSKWDASKPEIFFYLKGRYISVDGKIILK
jgi:hypothetical protein